MRREINGHEQEHAEMQDVLAHDTGIIGFEDSALVHMCGLSRSLGQPLSLGRAAAVFGLGFSEAEIKTGC